MYLPSRHPLSSQPQLGPIAFDERWAGKVIAAYLPSIGFVRPGRQVDPKRAIVTSPTAMGLAAWIDDAKAASEQRVSNDSFADTPEISVLFIQRSVSGFYGCRANIGSSFFFTEGNDASVDFFRGSFRVSGAFSNISAADRTIIWTNNGDLTSAAGTKLYVDNKSQSVGLVQSGSLSGSGPFKVGASPGDGWTGKNKFGLVVWFSKALTPVESALLSANPWQIFRTRRRVTFFNLGGSGGSTINATATGTARTTGAAALAAQFALSGIGVALATGQAAAAINVPLAAAGITVANGQAGAVATVAINASGIAQAAALAGLSPSVLAQAAGAVQAAGNAQLAVLLNALASGTGNASGSANLTGSAPGSLAASAQASAQGNAALAVTVQLQAVGAARAEAAANGSASAPGHLSAVGTGNASGWAAQSVLVNLTAAGFVHAMVQGALSVEVPLGAAGVASVSGLAQLGTVGPVRGARLVAGEAQLLTRGVTEAVAVTSFLCEAVHV